MLILYKNARNVRFVLFTKTSNKGIGPRMTHRHGTNGQRFSQIVTYSILSEHSILGNEIYVTKVINRAKQCQSVDDFANNCHVVVSITFF